MSMIISTPGSATATAGEKTQRGVMLVAGLFVVGIVTVSALLARSIPDDIATTGAAVGLTALLLFFAAGAVGAGLGFLFGLPRARFVDQTTGPMAEPGTVGRTGGPAFLANSNLVKVSDWLTTIVIGLGLVNLAKLGPAVDQLSVNLREPLGGSPNAGVIGVAIVIVGLLAGTLLTYLWTSTRVRELFEQTESGIESSIPDLSGKTVQEARDTMSTLALRLDVPPGTDDQDVVVDQTIAPGSSAVAGATLSVTAEAP